jgi:hypothetical protein
MTLPSCCEHHGVDCCQGRNCPERKTRRPIRYAIGYLSVFLRWRDHAAAKRAGHLATLIPTDPVDWELLIVWVGVAVAFGAVLALSIVDPRNLTDWLPAIWPRAVVALNFWS